MPIIKDTTTDPSLVIRNLTVTGVYSGSGASLTTINASSITTGTIGGSFLPFPSASVLGGVLSLAPASGQFVTGISTNGAVVTSVVGFSLLSGATTIGFGNIVLGASPLISNPLITGIQSVVKDGPFTNENAAAIYVRSALTAGVAGLILGTDNTNSLSYIQSISTASNYNFNLSINPNGGNIGLGATATDLSGWGVKTLTVLSLNGGPQIEFASARTDGAGLVIGRMAGVFNTNSANHKLIANINFETPAGGTANQRGGDVVFYTKPNASTSLQEVMRVTGSNTLTISGGLNANGTTNMIKGSSTNDSASAGYVGEYIESVVSSPTSFPSSTTWGDATSISLTAGDWDVDGIVNQDALANITVLEGGISTTSGNSTTGLVVGSNRIGGLQAAATRAGGVVISGYRISISSTTVVYLKITTTYSGSTPTYECRLSARRMR